MISLNYHTVFSESSNTWSPAEPSVVIFNHWKQKGITHFPLEMNNNILIKVIKPFAKLNCLVLVDLIIFFIIFSFFLLFSQISLFRVGVVGAAGLLDVLNRDISANTQHLYNICTMLAQRLRRWANIAQK